jgi:Uma2 family endonuclease
MTPSAVTPSAVTPAQRPTDAVPEQAVPEQAVLEPLPADIVWPPNDLDSDEPPLETTLHLQQMMMLLNCLHWLWKDRNDYFAAGNLTVYYSPQKRKSEDFRGPDFFVALNTQPHPRKSWMIWEEGGKYPDLIVELLSDSTAEVDRTLKKRLYAETFRTPEYFWFDPESQEFAGFSLIRGRYEPIEPTEQGWLWSGQLQLFLGVHEQRLRFFEANGQLVPTPDEAAIAAEQNAAISEQNAIAAEQNAIAAEQSMLAAQQSAIAAEQSAAAAEQSAAAAEQTAAAAEQGMIAAQQTAAAAEQGMIAAQQTAAAAEQRATQLADKLRELGIDPDTV